MFIENNVAYDSSDDVHRDPIQKNAQSHDEGVDDRDDDDELTMVDRK